MYFKKFWRLVIGPNRDFNLEQRIFHAFSFIGLIAVAYNIPFNISIGLPGSAVLAAGLFVVQAFLYYISRFKGSGKASLLILGVLLHAMFVINYLINEGLNGPTLLLMLLAIFFVIAVSEPKMYVFWLALNLILVSGLMLFDYYNPNFIEPAYVNRTSRYIDTYSAYFLCLSLFFIGLSYIKSNYHKAKNIIANRAKNLEELNSTKDKLFSIVSHDLRGPISSIKSYLELLSEIEIELKDSEEIKAELLQLTESTEAMLSNLLMWSKSQMDGIKWTKSPINLQQTFGPVIEVYQNVANTKGIKLITIIEPVLNVIADADMTQLIIRNLLSNAIKFTKSGGEIRLTAISKDGLGFITVSDTGLGMSPSQTQSLFTINAKASYGTNNEKGVGLGLSMCKEFVEAQNGKLWFESELGKGTSFYLSFVKAGSPN